MSLTNNKEIVMSEEVYKITEHDNVFYEEFKPSGVNWAGHFVEVEKPEHIKFLKRIEDDKIVLVSGVKPQPFGGFVESKEAS